MKMQDFFGKHSTNLQGVKMQDWKKREKKSMERIISHNSWWLTPRSKRWPSTASYL